MAEQQKKTTKTNTKKSSLKKKELVEKLVAPVEESCVFWCNDGQIFKSIEELINGFDKMTDETFLYHCNNVKSDFSVWILDVIGDEQLASDIKKAKTRKEAKDITQLRYYDLTRLEG